jgi:hypothetical protein
MSSREALLRVANSGQTGNRRSSLRPSRAIDVTGGWRQVVRQNAYSGRRRQESWFACKAVWLENATQFWRQRHSFLPNTMLVAFRRKPLISVSLVDPGDFR